MERPNIVFIFTDQQSSHMMSCAGNPHVKTPAMDRLAARGTRFRRAYCTNPVCVPSRFSLMTGRMPSAIGMRSNSSRRVDSLSETIKQGGLGWLLRRAGYETVYGGKVHLPKKTSPEEMGFDVITSDERDGLAEVGADYLRRDHDGPFLLVASFINPHDICYMAIRDRAATDQEKLLVRKGEVEVATLDRALRRPEGMDEAEFFAKRCPPLPPNFEPQEDEPEAIEKLIEQRPFRLRARANWSPARWRMHRWAYARLTEIVDAQIGRLLDAIEAGPHADNTVIVFSSDHGDMDSSHRLEHKTALYEEACRIPLIICQPGAPAGVVDDTHLVSNGLDLVPTFCDYAGVEAPSDLAGRSLLPLVQGTAPQRWRDALLVESEIGCMVRTDRYKYVLCDEGENREQLIDLKGDPFETRNAVRDADKVGVLAEHRKLFQALRGQLPGAAEAAQPIG